MNQTFIYIFTCVFTLFGSLIGSFSNVIILRMASGQSIVFPPSSCPKCGHRLGVLDLFPVFSWLFLRGKCRYCKAPISIQYPLVEAAIAIITGLSFFYNGFTYQFIAQASSLIIVFISNVIFFRNEIKTPNPCLWALMYFVLLQRSSGLLAAITVNSLLDALIIFAIIGAICYLTENNTKHTLNAAILSLISLLILASHEAYQINYAVSAATAAYLSVQPKTEKIGRLIFLIIQIIIILYALLYRQSIL